MSETMTVLALVNGMIGGIILVLPLLANQTTTYLIAPVTIISAFISFYSCLLCLRHLGQHRDLDESILFHFKNNNTYKKAYDILIGVSVFIILILYFSLICDQWEGMFGENPTISVINFFVLFPLIYFMKKY
jgi:amino acid permease